MHRWFSFFWIPAGLLGYAVLIAAPVFASPPRLEVQVGEDGSTLTFTTDSAGMTDNAGTAADTATAKAVEARLTAAGLQPSPLPTPSSSATASIVLPKPIKTGFFDLSYIGRLVPQDDSNPYFLFTGNPCKTCSSERALYLVRPAQGTADPKITTFVQPGKIFDPRTHALVMESRAFFGRCLSGHFSSADDVYVVFQRERVDHNHGRRHSMEPSVYIANASPDFLRETLIERHMPALKHTLSLVRMKKCHEIQGRSRMMVLKPHGLDWRNYQPSDDDDQDQDLDQAD